MNIVLLVVDTLRAKSLPPYGYEKDTAPFLSKMAEKHLFVENYYSNSPWTPPSHASMFTGELPSEHGTTSMSMSFDRPNILVNRLKELGYRTVGMSENFLIEPTLNFDRGFDKFIPMRDRPGEVWQEMLMKSWDSKLNKRLYFLWNALTRLDFESLKSIAQHFLEKLPFGLNFGEDYNPSYSERTIRKAEEHLQQEEDTFIFMNIMPVHSPYTFNREQKEEFLPNVPDERVKEYTVLESMKEYVQREDITEEELDIRRRAYEASIRYADGLVERLWRSSPDDTVFFVVGDHGQLFGEYDFGVPLVRHSFGTFKELVRPPLIVFSDIDFEIKKNKVYDHRDLHNMILSVAGSCRDIGRESTIAEFHGHIHMRGCVENEVPDRYKELFQRKSFSLINGEWKYDYASDGEYLWEAESHTEIENRSSEKNIVKKMRKELFDNLDSESIFVNLIDIEI